MAVYVTGYVCARGVFDGVDDDGGEGAKGGEGMIVKHRGGG